MEQDMTARFITAQQMGEILNMKEDGIWRLARQGKIPVVKIGRSMRFDPNDVVKTLKEGAAI